KGIHYYDVHPEAEQPCCWPLMKKVQPPSYYEFSYYSDRVAVGNIAILENTRGEKIVQLQYGAWGKIQPADVVQILNLMDKVYASLRNQMTNLPPETEMREDFFRVKKP